jgi:hypothetical protein
MNHRSEWLLFRKIMHFFQDKAYSSFQSHAIKVLDKQKLFVKEVPDIFSYL